MGLLQPAVDPATELVFKLDTAGILTTLHAFNFYDGAAPMAGLQLRNGMLYGTTREGTTYGYGTVFGINVSTNVFETIYSFTGPTRADGGFPNASVIEDGSGNLYGTTSEGGNSASGIGDGTIFKINVATGQETILHVFAGLPTEGSYPVAPLVRDTQGNLYGITENGGTFNYGTVFKLDPSGTLTTLYSFTGGMDGAYPYAGLAQDAKGKLYGVTSDGGAGPPCFHDLLGCGTIFELTP